MRFQVPQFIEVEDKIFGPLTFKQFVYVAGGAGISFAIWRFLPLFIAAVPMIAVMGFSLALAFYRPNSKPFINIVEAAFKYATSNRLYIWKKENKKVVPIEEQAKMLQGNLVPKLSDSKLQDLSWSLDIKDPANKQR